MTRLRAFTLHLGASAAAIGVFAAVLLLLWFPPLYMNIEGAPRLLGIVFGVDVVLGPLLTLILFKPGKRGLKFDMVIVLIMQLSALTWGMWTAYHERPAYMVFNLDRFTVVAHRQVDYAELSDSVQRHNAATGPVLVYVERPSDPTELSELVEAFIWGKGKDLPFHGDKYRPYAGYVAPISAASLDPEKKGAISEVASAAVNEFVSEHGGSIQDYGFYPVEGRKTHALVVTRRASGELLSILPVDPWPEPASVKTENQQGTRK